MGKEKLKWDTGFWQKQLTPIVNAKCRGDEIAVYQAQYIHKLMNKTKGGITAGGGTNEDSTYSFEEDLWLHIKAAQMVIVSGIGVLVFQNTFFWEYLAKMNLQHVPIYWLKFTCLLCCIMTVLTKELQYLFMEGYLQFRSSFVASTSDFWLDNVRKQKSFGATIANFMAYSVKKKWHKSVHVKRMHNTIMAGGCKLDVLLAASKRTIGRCQALVNFQKFKGLHSGASIALWLEDSHQVVRCKTEYMYSHATDGGEKIQLDLTMHPYFYYLFNITCQSFSLQLQIWKIL